MDTTDATPDTILYTPKRLRIGHCMPALFACVIASACGPGAAVDDLETLGDSLETGDSDSGAPTFPDGEVRDFGGVPDVPQDSCDGAPDPISDCDLDGRCWTISPGWSAWARHADPTMIDAMVELEILSETMDSMGVDGDCYDVNNSDRHVCVVVVDCIPLLGSPLSEVEFSESACANGGPWTPGIQQGDPTGQCFGKLQTVMVELDPLR